ncbi:MAG TPA: hypothetical protein VLH08_02880 [Acidobacteriota bacterium]|nr:hypothetical protein [Acidobacteriota bacterium]
MSKNTKLLLGLGSIAWIIVCPALMLLIGSVWPTFRYNILVSITAGWLLFTISFVYTTFHAMKNAAIPSANKTRWMMYLLFCNVIAVPVYWYRYIWRIQ